MDLKKFWESSRSTIVSAFIAIVVIAGLFFVFNVLPEEESTKEKEEQKQEQTKEGEEKKPSDEEEQDKTKLPAKYTVKQGDNLWKISKAQPQYREHSQRSFNPLSLRPLGRFSRVTSDNSFECDGLPGRRRIFSGRNRSTERN